MSELYSNLRRLARRWLNPIGIFALRLRCRFGPRVSIPGDQKCTFVVASFLRPKNIQLIIDSLVKCEFAGEIVISNHNPDIAIADYIDCDDDRLKILTSKKKEPCGYRYTVANRLSAEYFMVVDDDIFLFPEQFRKLFLHLLEQPEIPHGFHGTMHSRDVGEDGLSRITHVAGCEATVNVLHQAYAITREHVERFREIADAAVRSGLFPDEDPSGFADDMMISFSGDGQPRVHDLSPILTCPTSLDEDVAACGGINFGLRRTRILGYLRDTARSDNSVTRLPGGTGAANDIDAVAPLSSSLRAQSHGTGNT